MLARAQNMNLLTIMHLSPEDAMKALGVSPSEFSRYLALLKKQRSVQHCVNFLFGRLYNQLEQKLK